MAHFSTTVATSWSQTEAFAYMADLRNFERWDPGVRKSVLVAGDEPGPGAAYDVTVSGTTLRYETLDFQPPTRTVVEAKSSLLRSYDVIDVTETPTGTTVRYDATLELNGPLKLLDPVLGLVFNRIGEKAAAGMERALSGQRTS